MTFHDLRLPKFMECFAIGISEFSTSSVSTLSGREVRGLDKQYATQKYLIKNCYLSLSEFEEFAAFFMARRGSKFSFRFRDNFDYIVSKQIISKGDSKTTKFQLNKIYKDPVSPYVRIISKPAKEPCEFFIDGLKIDAKINFETAEVVLSEPLGNEKILSGSFAFDVHVRFSKDSYEYFYSSDGSIKLSDIELLEVI